MSKLLFLNDEYQYALGLGIAGKHLQLIAFLRSHCADPHCLTSLAAVSLAVTVGASGSAESAKKNAMRNVCEWPKIKCVSCALHVYHWLEQMKLLSDDERAFFGQKLAREKFEINSPNIQKMLALDLLVKKVPLDPAELAITWEKDIPTAEAQVQMQRLIKEGKYREASLLGRGLYATKIRKIGDAHAIDNAVNYYIMMRGAQDTKEDAEKSVTLLVMLQPKSAFSPTRLYTPMFPTPVLSPKGSGPKKPSENN